MNPNLAAPTNVLDLPLHLFQVLEEEYISLYGQLEQETIIDVEGRKITTRLNWEFHPGHIKNFEKFKSNLLTRPDLPATFKGFLDAQTVKTWNCENDAVNSLNGLLGERFYVPNDFRYFNFSETTKKLLELYAAEGGPNKIGPDELSRLNRFLLDEVFAEHLENVSEIRLAAIYQRRHAHDSAALCLSGGGIRSGTFALGLLQGLARHKLLKQFDYLSTVSGGGYMGAWLSAWTHRHPTPHRGLDGVVNDLTNATPERKIDPDPEAIRHLREYSNFLTPKAGLLSTDTWTFLAIYIRNLLLNWSVIIPLILAFLLIPRFSVAAIQANPTEPVVENLRYLFLFVGFLFAAWAIAYVGFSRPGFRTLLIKRNPRWKDRMDQRGFLKYCLVPLVSAAILLTTYWAWTHKEKPEPPLTEITLWECVGFGAATALLGLFFSFCVLRAWRDFRSYGKFGALLTVIAGGVGGLFVYAGTLSDTLTGVIVDYSWRAEYYACTAVPLFLLMFMLALIVFAGISSHLLNRVTDEDREWWARFSAWALICALAWTVFSSLVVFGPIGLLAFPKLVGSIGGISGLVALLVGRSSKMPATEEKVSQASLPTQVFSQSLPVLAFIFLAFLVAALSLLTTKLTRPASDALNSGIPSVNRLVGTNLPQVTGLNRQFFDATFTGPVHEWFKESGWEKIGDPTPGYVEHMRAVHYPRWWFFLGLIILAAAIGLLFSRVINLNLFSLHNGYRNRLIRGFLAASRSKQQRRPNPFTGFDPADNVSMHELRPALLHEVDFSDLEGFAEQLKKGGQALKERQETTVREKDARPVKKPEDPASEFLYTKLSVKGKEAADGSNPPTPLSQSQRVDLIEDLNRILESDQIHLWEKPGFAVCALSDDRPKLQDAVPPLDGPRHYHIHLNRRALDDKYPEFIVRSNYPPHRLLHVVNTTLNLVGGDNLAWQQRKAESFTVSPLHCGSYRVGYRPSKYYGGDDGISLGTAMAISGAAASSNMGYYTTSPLLSLVLTLFNVRLGWWLGNPGPVGSRLYKGMKPDDPSAASKRIYRRMAPTLSVKPVVDEAFGLTDDRSEYVYLTDGGHFENLGLYEMVLRRCHLIVVSDAAADAKFEFNDLANAVRKVRVDLGIHIEFPDVPIYAKRPEKDGEGGCYWTIGVIRYSDLDRQQDGSKAPDGVLIYIKPAIYEDEPEDVIHYKRTHPTFPHETTADQFFDEPQFESYRALGSYIMDRMCGSHSGELNLVGFITQVNKNFLQMAPQVKAKYCEFWAAKT